MPPDKPILIATRGSALALAQANTVLAQCRAAFPDLRFELKIIKTTGDKLQTASMSQPDASLPKGLFTKELETALLRGRADIAVHSLKDLPTELPPGLKLGGVGGRRQDIRDVLIFRDATESQTIGGAGRSFRGGTTLAEFPQGITLATSSTRRAAQILAVRPDFKIAPIRGNVATRLDKLLKHPDLDATVLAAAGLARLKIQITRSGKLLGEGIPGGLAVTFLEPDQVLPCVGQAAIGLEIRENDERLQAVCDRLSDKDTLHAVTAERALLRAMGGGCQTPLGAFAETRDGQVFMRAVSYVGGQIKRAQGHAPAANAVSLGEILASQLTPTT